MAQILSGQPVVDSLKQRIVKEVKAHGSPFCLAVIIPTQDPSCLSYLKARTRLCQELGIVVKPFLFDGQETREELIKLVDRLNQDAQVQGIMIDRPFPAGMDEGDICSHIDYRKDIDGCSLVSSDKLMNGQPCLIPSTAVGIVEILKYYKIPLKDHKVTIVNQSRTVGLPLKELLTKAQAKVTICHEKTKDIPTKCKNADVVVVAIGVPHYFDKKYFTAKSIVIDVGINYDNKGELCGDVATESYQLVQAYTPVPGGVGPVTTVCLLTNLLNGVKLKG